jgi:UDP-hydrolysing UDP-N-acetyl-D-glucosamine 2-epimerase
MAGVKRVAVVTTSRADYGIYRPLLKLLVADRRFDVTVIVAGAHLTRAHGHSVRWIEEDGFPIGDRVECLLASDTAEATALAMGLATQGYARALARLSPDLVAVLGDRFEMHAAAVAASPFPVGIAHLYGGELSFGAIDDAWRHSITKLAHLHFVSTQDSARRVAQLGEEDWRIHNVGALSLDNLAAIEPLDRTALEAIVGLSLEPAPLLVTYHPTTRDYANKDEAGPMLSVLRTVERPIVITAPNADPGNQGFRKAYAEFAAKRAKVALIENLGIAGYFGLMRHAAAIVGNSSSAIIEAPSFAVPAVNIGERQEGRIRGANVIDCANEPSAIAAAIETACDPTFRRRIADTANPYRGERDAAPQIADALARAPCGDDLLRKRFVDRVTQEPGRRELPCQTQEHADDRRI